MKVLINLGSARATEALSNMLETTLGEEYALESPEIDVATALLIVNTGKRVADRPQWFPFGKWAMLTHIHEAVISAIEARLVQMRVPREN